VKTTATLALAAALALSLANGALASSNTAYFKVSLVASQDVTWTEQLTYRTDCGSGFMQLEGNGTSALRVRTTRPQPAVARRQSDGRIALSFRRGGQALPVKGTLTRHGASHATGQARDDCPDPGSPVASDCGTRRFGGHSTIGVGYYTQDEWPSDLDTPPLTNAIGLTGPSVPGWRGVVFEWCPGASGDQVLGGPLYEPSGPRSSPGGLKANKLFGTRRHFKVLGHSKRTVDTAPMGAAVSGSFPITTTIDWTMTFVRVAHRPSGL
jgi:hypothetical protein